MILFIYLNKQKRNQKETVMLILFFNLKRFEFIFSERTLFVPCMIFTEYRL